MNAVTKNIVPIPTLYSNFFFMCKDMTLRKIVAKTEQKGSSVVFGALIPGAFVNDWS